MLRRWHISFAVLLFALMSGTTKAQSNNDQRMIADIKGTAVSKLDTKLPNTRLDTWVQSLIGDAPQTWEVAACSEPTGFQSYDANLPVCAKLFSQLPDGRTLRLWIAIGTRGSTRVGPPVLWLGYFGEPGQEKPTSQLSDLPELVKGIVGRIPI